MKLNNISLPYPVLGISDDVMPMLEPDCLTIKVEDDGMGNYRFTVTMKHENECIHQLIRDGYAEYSCEVDCARAMFRRCYTSDKGKIKIVIPRQYLNGRVDFNSFVSVKKPFNYKNPEFNEDYEGYSFKMELGDVLVAFPPTHYDVDIKYDQLQAAGSFMQIREGIGRTVTYFDVSGDKIEILLPTPLYNMYREMIGKDVRFMEIFHSSIVLNALTQALFCYDEYSHTTWARTIKYRVDSDKSLSQYNLEELEPDQVPQLAQELLKDPYGRMFDRLKKIKENNENDEEE